MNGKKHCCSQDSGLLTEDLTLFPSIAGFLAKDYSWTPPTLTPAKL